MRNYKIIILAVGLLANFAAADTPPPGTVKAKTWSGDGNTGITVTGTALDVNVTNASGLTTVNQGTGGSSAWKVNGSGVTQPVSGTFWQALQPVSGTLTCNAGSGTLAVSVASLPALATGSNTIGNVNINGTVPVSGTVSTTNTANGNTGSAVPAQATQVGGSDGTNLRALKVSSTGVLSVDGSAVTQPVSGTFWQATQPVSGTVTANAGTGTFTVDASGHTVPVSGTFWQATQPVSGTFWQATQPVSAASLPLPSGASTSAKQPALGTAGTASADVITVQGVTSMTPLKVDASGTTVPVSGTVIANAGTGTFTVDGSGHIQPVSGTFWQATQPVSAASLPLPTGASTSAKQPALGAAGTASADVITVQGITSMTALKIDGSAVTQPVSGTFWQATQPVSGTFWQATQPVSGTVTVNAGSGTMNTSQVGRSKANAPARNDYTSVNVTTAAYVQLVASTSNATSEVEIFDSSGQTLYLATGAAASEVNQIIIFPGGNGRIPLAIPTSTRVSIKAISATANQGEIDVNFYQ